MSERLLTYAEVAEHLAVTGGWLYRHRANLQAKHGFPPPVPGMGLRWDPLAIAAWLAERRAPRIEMTAPLHLVVVPTEDQLAGERELLTRRAASLGQKGRAA